jgi:hypothetical protein
VWKREVDDHLSSAARVCDMKKGEKKSRTVEIADTTPLKWPEGYGRTLINDRQDRAAWKKQYSVYKEAVISELELLGASAVTITRNPPSDERVDPGVAVWFSRRRSQDTSWQLQLRIDKPNPTRQEIETAFKTLAKDHHPDMVTRGSGGDVRIYMKLEAAKRQALAWIRGEGALDLDSCIPCDDYIEARQNLAAIKLILSHIRALERLGSPFIMERVMERTFRASLPAAEVKEKEEVESGVPNA